MPESAQSADYPDLVPLAPILTTSSTTPERHDATETALAARVAGLKSRADRLRGDVIDRRTRARMARGVTRG